MQTRLKLKPGQRGTKKLQMQCGNKLMAVRYRYDAQKKKRYKTVEIIVEEIPWSPQPRRDALVAVRVNWGEADLARQVKRAGGKQIERAEKSVGTAVRPSSQNEIAESLDGRR